MSNTDPVQQSPDAEFSSMLQMLEKAREEHPELDLSLRLEEEDDAAARLDVLAFLNEVEEADPPRPYFVVL
jgi:hypothetical protein